jgi:group I intron endonuclease
MGLIYKYTNKINGKSYIGQTTRTIEERLQSGYSAKFKNAITKYGLESFELSIIEENVLVESLSSKEIYWINHYDSFKSGYNSTLGGDGSGSRPWTEDQKRSLSKRNTGKNNPFFGKKHPGNNGHAIICTKLDGSFVGEYQSIKKAAQILSIGVDSIIDVAKEKKKSSCGYVFQYKNKNRYIQNLDNKIKTCKERSKPIIMLSLQEISLKEFVSCVEAAKHVNGSCGNISSCANGRLKTSYGYKWKYK